MQILPQEVRQQLRPEEAHARAPEGQDVPVPVVHQTLLAPVQPEEARQGEWGGFGNNT